MLRAFSLAVSGICWLCLNTAAMKAEEPSKPQSSSRNAEVSERTVDLFAAMDSGEVEAELIAPSARQVYLRVKNNTPDVLTINLPKAFGGVPVLAQWQPNGFGPGQGAGVGQGQPFGGAGAGQLGQFGQGNGGGSQGLGGGFGQGQVGNQIGNGLGNQLGNGFGNGQGNQLGNGFGNGRGLFRVLPGRVGKVMAQTVCLEHGKPDPTSRHKYRIVPIEQMPQADERIVEVCRLLGSRAITQNVAQAVAWHVTDGLSWDELAAKNRSESRYTGNVKFFSAADLDAARLLLDQLEQVAAQSTQTYVSLGKITPTACPKADSSSTFRATYVTAE